MKRFLPDTIFARLFLMVLLAIVISHMMTFVLLLAFFGERQHRPLPGERRPQVLAPGDPAQAVPGPRARPFRRPPDMIIAGYAVRTPPPGFWISMASQLFALTVAALFGARMLARPIQRLGHAAAELGADLNRPPIAETGTAEARQAARVFNQMQQRIRQSVEERGRFLAAVSHDLRTPLTRMKLRVERLQDDAARDKLREDIAEMAAMLNATLSYLRDEASAEAWQMMDVTALLESMVEDALDAGEDVTVSGQAKPLLTRPLALRRCLSNLLQNALRYGHQARIVIADTDALLAIDIVDAGPGIPEDRMEAVFEPFVRLENSRNRSTGGVGLGLAIAREAASQCGGTLALENVPGGLRARLLITRAG
nr:ATP-binding protein [uncultured Noviherbaspirillum sp.]